MNHYVYEITNNINGKKYIGKRSCKCPIEEDKYMGSGKILRQAQKKYGIENFSKEILKICKSEEDAYNFEREEVLKVKANINPLYYNISIGGKGGMNGFKFAEESKEKMRAAQIGRKLDYETRLKISNSNKGREVSLETREKISKSNKGVKRSEQARINISNACKGRIISEEARKKIGLAHKGKIISQETRNKISIANKGKVSHMLGKEMSEETKQKISTSNTGKKRTLETRRKLSESRKGFKLTKEQRDYLSIIRKGKINLGENNGMYGKFGKLNHKSKEVSLLNTGEVFESIHEASKKYNVNPSNICACCKGKVKSAGKLNGEKMIWKYVING